MLADPSIHFQLSREIELKYQKRSFDAFYLIRGAMLAAMFKETF